MDMSPWALFLTAGPVGKGVMVVLLLASVWSWALIGEAVFTTKRLGRALRRARAGGDIASELQPLLEAGRMALARPRAENTRDIRRAACDDAMARAGRDLLLAAERGLSDLAVVSTTAPFVGLFGTVWGIMTSFGSLGIAHESSIAAVAPGIAEALAATAWGLAAAIPASVGFNRLGAAFARIDVEIDAWINETADHLACGPESGDVPEKNG